MSKISVFFVSVCSLVLLVGCGTKSGGDLATAPVDGTDTANEAPVALDTYGDTGSADMPTVTEDDIDLFDTLVGGKWATSVEEKGSVFRFYPENIFEVTAGGNTAQGPWIISEGNILLGESRLELIIVDEDTITIQGIEYKRFPDTV